MTTTKEIQEEFSVKTTSSKWVPSKLARYAFKGWGNTQKETTALSIVENKKGEVIFKNSQIEIYVKNQAIPFNYVQNFNLSKISNLQFCWYNVPHYNASWFQTSHYYKVGDIVYASIYTDKNMYKCTTAHTSSSVSFWDDYNAGGLSWKNWVLLEAITDGVLSVNKNINQNYYTKDFPYVGELIFKNIWGCDFLNNLQTFVKSANLLIEYYSSYSENMRTNMSSFFDWGYISNATLVMGNTFDKDEILGNTKLNKYFEVSNTSHYCGSSWSASSDSTVTTNFPNSGVYYPFDHWTKFAPHVGIPHFKNREFTDSYISFSLKRKDKLGNEIKNTINLPIHVLFYNNLIKTYFIDSTYGVTSEHMNSNDYNTYSVKNNGDTIWVHTEYVWCPNPSKLSIASFTIDNAYLQETAKIVVDNLLTGCYVTYSFKIKNTNPINSVLVLEYSDGENYDRFTMRNYTSVVS